MDATLFQAPGGEAHAVRRSSVALLVARVVSSRRLLGAALRFIVTVTRFFFLSQWAARLRPGRIPLVAVDHPLDARVPFKPESASIYLDFIGLWVHALAYALERQGRPAYDDAVRFMDGLARCYTDAYGVYRRCVSTTARPQKAVNARLALIYALDPHLYCVPSLHVMVVCVAWLELRAFFERQGVLESEAPACDAVYARAIAITDSIIYLKQHSVNCIPAALYMLGFSRVDFGRTDSMRFFDSLLGDPALDAVRPEADRYMRDLYTAFMDEGSQRGGDYRDVLVDFLLRYGAERGSMIR